MCSPYSFSHKAELMHNRGNNSHYTFDFSTRFLSPEETSLFSSYLNTMHLDAHIWNIFAGLFRSATKATQPYMLRAYENTHLCGAAILIKCTQYGRALFDNPWLIKIFDLTHFPFYMWLKYGCCMDMLSNPGFAVEPEKAGEIFSAMADYLRQRTLLTVITDYCEKASLYPHAGILPFMPHGLVATSGMRSLQDFTGAHKNIKKRLNSFKNNGGDIDILHGAVDEPTLAAMKRCFMATAGKSSVYLPYQDLYLQSALAISTLPADYVYHFIARKDGELLGYQAAIKTGSRLNALHGAFDRERETNYYAYDNLIVKMTEFAIQEGLESVDFGSILNITKQRLMNQSIAMSYYLFSKYALAQWLLVRFFKFTKSQGKEQMKFAQSNAILTAVLWI
jgi:hypothetical protein